MYIVRSISAIVVRVTRTEINFFIRIFIPTDAGSLALAKCSPVTIAARDKGSINRTVKGASSEGKRYPDESLILKIPNKSDEPSADIEHIRR